MISHRFTSFHSQTAEPVALCAALNMPAGDAPDWVHLLPAGEIRTGDGRGPYRVADADELIRQSRIDGGDRLPIDENHATDLAAPQGRPAPARGWISELEARTDGIWGRVEWTGEGQRLLSDRAYRGISPVIHHTRDGRVTAILRASLVNRPNLRGLTALHAQTSQENTMDLLAKLVAALGLSTATTEDQLVEKVTSLHSERGQQSTALHAALDPIASLVGLQAGSDAKAVLAGVQTLKAAGGGDDAQAITALQAELKTVTEQLNTIAGATKRERAESFVDGEIKKGRVGLKPVRDRYVAMHQADPEGTAALIEAMPILGAGGSIVPATPPVRDGEISLNAEQASVARMLGVDPKDVIETLKAEREAAL